jgi:outer membrane protein assembly factor BamB
MVGLGGSEQDVVGSMGNSIVAVDYQTGKIPWKYRFEGTVGGYGGATGLLATAGGLLFANDGSGNFVAFSLTGTKPPVPLWHARIGSIDNAAETFTVGGRQYVLVAAEGAVYAFYLQ